MNLKIFISVILFLATWCVTSPVPDVPNDVTLQLLGQFSAPSPGFLFINDFKQFQEPTLFITSFGTEDQILIVENLTSNYRNPSSLKPQLFSKAITWPNQALAIPYNIFTRDALVACGGFLVPFKSTGRIVLFDLNNFHSSGTVISKDKSNYFYHRTIWFDVDGDGLQDILSARATKPIFGSSGGELVWLKNPGPSKAFSGAWQETTLISGPDVFFKLYDLDKDGVPELLTAQFFSSPGFYVYWTESGKWSDGSSIKSRLIDSSVGQGFDLSLVDLNADGKTDVLFTNHVNDPKLSGCYAYEIPNNFKTDSWTRHTLLNGIVTKKSGVGQASPNEAVAVQPKASAGDSSQKPVIVLGGDGSEQVYLIYPTSTSPSDWTYQTKVVVDVGGTVGQIAAGDIDGDGYTEVFVPAYDSSKVLVYTFGPK